MTEITDRWLAHNFAEDIADTLRHAFDTQLTHDSPFGDVHPVSEHSHYTHAREKLELALEQVDALLKWTVGKMYECTPRGSDGQNHD